MAKGREKIKEKWFVVQGREKMEEEMNILAQGREKIKKQGDIWSKAERKLRRIWTYGLRQREN